MTFGINRATIVRMVEEIADVTRLGVQVAVVIGGQYFRGVAGGSVGMDRATADYMGMLATVMNALALADAMDKPGPHRSRDVCHRIEQVVEPYVRPKALQYLEEGKVVVFAAGTGNPFFTTDTAPLCVVPRSALKWYSRQRRWTAFIPPTLERIPLPRVTRSSALTRPCPAIWASWTLPHLPCAVIKTAMRCSPSSSRAPCGAW